MAEITKPEWQVHRYGDGQTMRIAGIGDITVSWESGSRDKNDPRPGHYKASVFGNVLKATSADRETLKAYAIKTAKEWCAKGVIRLELASDASA